MGEPSTHTLLDRNHRQGLMARFRSLRPEARARWGRMVAPEMLAHLSDQMRHTLGDVPIVRHPSPLRWPIVKQVVLYLLPWPRGRVQGPPEAFVTRPTGWEEDLAAFEALVERFVSAAERTDWPEHPFFGGMSRRSWGAFCHRHFDHHLRQFGA